MEVILYSTHCPKCNVLEKKLQNAGINYVEVNDVDIMVSKGLLSVPNLEVDGKMMDFVQATNWIKEQ